MALVPQLRQASSPSPGWQHPLASPSRGDTGSHPAWLPSSPGCWWLGLHGLGSVCHGCRCARGTGVPAGAAAAATSTQLTQAAVRERSPKRETRSSVNCLAAGAGAEPTRGQGRSAGSPGFPASLAVPGQVTLFLPAPHGTAPASVSPHSPLPSPAAPCGGSEAHPAPNPPCFQPTPQHKDRVPQSCQVPSPHTGAPSPTLHTRGVPGTPTHSPHPSPAVLSAQLYER